MPDANETVALIHPDAPVGKSLKYAQPELERRFLLASIPDQPIVRTARIADNYIIGSRLRLRRSIEIAAGVSMTVYKLTQKVPSPDGHPGLITTLYLDENEYRTVAVLPAKQLHKIRYSMPPLSIDVFEAPLEGLVMAEAGFTSESEMQGFAPPPFAVAEVTTDIRFTGGCLVTTSRSELLRGLNEFGIRPNT